MDRRNARFSLEEDEYERLERYEKLADLFRETADDEEDSEDYWSEAEELEE